MEQLIENMDVSPKSKNVYLSLLKRLEREEFKIPMKTPQRETYIKDFFGEKFEKISTRLDMLNLIIILRKAVDMKIDKLVEYRNELVKLRLETNIQTLNDKKKDLITLGEFEECLDTFYRQKNYKGYIVNYLWSRYGVRNKDVDVEIVKRKQDVKNDKNYLYLVKGRVEYIRNDYKTRPTYGVKRHLIVDEKFIEMVKSHGVGKVLEGSQIGNALRKLMIKGMGEADIFKVLIADCYDREDTERVNELSFTRGTNVNTIKAFYDVNAKKEIIREI